MDALTHPAVGTIAPEFELADSGGRPLRLSDMAAKGSVVLLFYRGHW